MSNYDFDYFVIGGGSGGVRSARIAVGHGAKVAIAEGKDYGGTCVNVGCVPKKLFAYASDFGPAFEDARGYGWSATRPAFDWNILLKNKNEEIKRLNSAYKTLLDNAGVKRFDDYASFINTHTLEVGGEQITAEHILIATGGTPRRPTFKGAEHVIVSDEAFYLKDFPKSVVLQGGGYVAVEFAHIFHGLGAHVTLLYRGPMFLRGFDEDMPPFLAEEMKKQGIDLHFETDIESVSKNDDQFIVNTTTGRKIETGLVFSAIGRDPNIDGLNVKAAGIALTETGQIKINEDYQTNIPHIYAVGDVANQYHLTPVALAEGHVLADRLFNKQKDRSVDYRYVPTAIFSGPPCGTVGLSEQDARAKGLEIEIYKTDFKPMIHTLSGRDERTFMKLIINKADNKVIGCHMVGRDVPEMLQGIAVAMNAGATKADFDRTIGIHPTSAEEFVTMRTPVSN